MTVLRRVARVLAVPGALLVGLLTGLSAVLLHRDAFPGGLLLGAVTTYAVAWWLLGCRRRWLATLFAAGWLAVFLTAAPGRPEGDLLVAGDVPGYALIVVAVGLVVAGLVGLTGRAAGGGSTAT